MDEVNMIKRVKDGDHEAFRFLMQRYKSTVEKFAFQFGLLPDEVQDVTQEVFLKVYNNISKYEGGKFSTWIYQICLNVTRDYFRKQQRERRKWKKAQRDAEVTFREETAKYFSSEEKAEMHGFIRGLNEKYRTPIILYYFHEMSYEEIAEATKVSLSAVKSRIHRAKAKLKTAYENSPVEEVRNHG
ncbi:RNA polymerase sigma factor [Thalassobacillus hwangdonensis]|uniref:RNA polymerase sigma factor n=1 Tax=Thalassobacillus hwangdonensis TaxID=546108 RepID=A0ABW3L3F3_9BACI